MNTIEALRAFKLIIERRLIAKTGWGKNEFQTEIDKAYQEILEHLINSNDISQNPKT